MSPPIKLSKKTAIGIVVVLYIAISLGYILYGQWQDFRADSAQRSFLEGRALTIEQIIQQAEDENCQPFFVFSDDKRVNLINIDCLQTVEPNQTSSN